MKLAVQVRLLPTPEQASALTNTLHSCNAAAMWVDPAYTSQTCHLCGHVDKKNRRSQASFVCGRCGFVGHADHNAARNIAQRGAVCWGEAMRPHAAPTLAASKGGSSKPTGAPASGGLMALIRLDAAWVLA